MYANDHTVEMKVVDVLSISVVLRLADVISSYLFPNASCYPGTMPTTAPVQPSAYCFSSITTSHSLSFPKCGYSPTDWHRLVYFSTYPIAVTSGISLILLPFSFSKFQMSISLPDLIAFTGLSKVQALTPRPVPTWPLPFSRLPLAE